MKIPKFDITINSNIGEHTLLSFIDSCEGKKKINVFLHTSGGDAESSWSIVEYVRLCNIEMNVYCSRAESAGIIILLAAKNKYAFKHCSFMYHLGISGDGKLEEYEKHKKKTDYFNELYRKITPSSIKLSHKPTYLNAKEALKLKIIDKIL